MVVEGSKNGADNSLGHRSAKKWGLFSRPDFTAAELLNCDDYFWQGVVSSSLSRDHIHDRKQDIDSVYRMGDTKYSSSEGEWGTRYDHKMNAKSRRVDISEAQQENKICFFF